MYLRGIMTQHWEIKVDGLLEAIDQDKTYIILQKVNRKPPHLGIIAGDDYISLSAKGIQNKSFNQQLELLNRSHTPCILFEMNYDAKHFKKHFIQECEKIGTLNEDITCLLPIKNTLYNYFQKEQAIQAQYIYELIPMLDGDILKTLVVNLKVEDFKLPLYTMDEIKSCIQRYKND